MVDGHDTAGLDPARVNRLGVARTFQNIAFFNSLTVEENVAVGLHNQHHCGMATSILRLPASLGRASAGITSVRSSCWTSLSMTGLASH